MQTSRSAPTFALLSNAGNAGNRVTGNEHTPSGCAVTNAQSEAP